MRRRDVLLFSAGGILASAGAAGWWAATREPLAALAPWREAAFDADDPRIGVFRHAILAPNPAQPATLADPLDRRGYGRNPLRSRQASARDRSVRPANRHRVRLLSGTRAPGRGRARLRLDIAPFPDGAGDPRLDGRPIAQLTFRADPTLARDPLFAAIPARRSVKEPFDPARPVSAEALARLLASAGIAPDVTAMGTVDAARVAPLRDLALRAWRIEAATPTAWRESVDLMRIGKAEIEAAPDGIDLGGPMFEALSHARLVTRATLADTGSTAFREGARAYEAMFATSMGFVWLATRANTRTDQLAAGAAYVRLNLAATAMGVSLHPVSQALQEFPEKAGPRAEAGALAPGARVQMLARIGYADPVPPSPRWPLAAKLTKA